MDSRINIKLNLMLKNKKLNIPSIFPLDQTYLIGMLLLLSSHLYND